MTEYKQSYHAIIRCGKYTAAVIGMWTIWCFLMVAWPQTFAPPAIRAVARVSIVLIPAIIYYFRNTQENNLLDYFLLREHWVRGVIFGGGIAILYFAIDWLGNFSGRPYLFHFPVGFSIWFNFIIGSPLAEELFFRGVLLQELKTSLGATKATVISAFAFAMLHLPQWLILDNLYGIELLTLFATIFIYGVIFALFVNLTRSLWGSLLPHWINNFILLAMS